MKQSLYSPDIVRRSIQFIIVRFNINFHIYYNASSEQNQYNNQHNSVNIKMIIDLLRNKDWSIYRALTFNQGGRSSNLRWLTKPSFGSTIFAIFAKLSGLFGIEER